MAVAAINSVPGSLMQLSSTHLTVIVIVQQLCSNMKKSLQGRVRLID